MTANLHFLQKLSLLVLISVLSFIFASQAYAQMSRAEKKKWKKELRQLKPEKLKLLIEEKQHLTSVLNFLTNDNNQLKTATFEKQQKIVFLQTEVKDLTAKLKTREIQLGLVSEGGERWDSGVVFKVQIGALRPRNSADLDQKNYVFEVEDSPDYIQYVIGHFRDYHEADILKKQMRKIGMNKAWIVPYKNGKRVPLKEVLQVVLEN